MCDHLEWQSFDSVTTAPSKKKDGIEKQNSNNHNNNIHTREKKTTDCIICVVESKSVAKRTVFAVLCRSHFSRRTVDVSD